MALNYLFDLRVVRAALLFCAALAASATVRAAEYTTEDYKRAITACMRVNDFACAEKNWQQILRLSPDDTAAMVNLGLIMSWRDNQKGAIAQYERAINLGEGAYNLFAYYADSLGKVGRIDEAIDWSYKTLSIVPTLVDVRGKLAKLLLHQKKYYEALSLLESYDDQLIATGNPAYFTGQRIAIESVIERNGAGAAAEEQSLRLPKFGGYFFAPVGLGELKPSAFVVDTGAGRLTISDDYLSKSKAGFKVTGAGSVTVADGRKVPARAVTLDSVRVGPYVLKNVSAIVCRDCKLLLGQTTLAKFDMKSVKVQGVEFMTLSPRKM